MDNLTSEYNQPVAHPATQTEHHVRLTAPEVANLWSSWMESSLKECTSTRGNQKFIQKGYVHLIRAGGKIRPGAPIHGERERYFLQA